MGPKVLNIVHRYLFTKRFSVTRCKASIQNSSCRLLQHCLFAQTGFIIERLITAKIKILLELNTSSPFS